VSSKTKTFKPTSQSTTLTGFTSTLSTKFHNSGPKLMSTENKSKSTKDWSLMRMFRLKLWKKKTTLFKVNSWNSICFDNVGKIRMKQLSPICLITGLSICAILISLRAPFMHCIERVPRKKINAKSPQPSKKASTTKNSRIPILCAWFKSKNKTQNWTRPINSTKMTFTWLTVFLW
jgi:hypothetical protein